MLISTVIFIVKDDKLLLAKLCRDITLISPIDADELRAMRLDTLAAIVLCEFALPMKFGIFISDKGLENIFCSDSTIFI